MKELLSIFDINIKLEFNINKTKQLYEKYINLSKQAQENWESKYSHINGYKSYVYYIYDTVYDMYYIGVRYTPYKNNENLLEDLLNYQSSSSNKTFKNRLKNNIEEFKLGILKEFNNEFDAQNYEALLHQILEVENNPKLYNKTTECFLDYKIYFTPLYDLKEAKEVYYKDIKSDITYHDVYNIVNNKIMFYIKDRYCLVSNITQAKCEYDKQHKLIVLWKYQHRNRKIKQINITYQECTKLLGADKNKLLNNKYRYVKNYYINKDDIITDYTLYKIWYYDELSLKIKYKEIYYKDAANVLGKNGILLISGKRISTNGYYIDKNICEKYNTIYTLWYFNNTSKQIEFIKVYYKDIGARIGQSAYSLINKKVNNYKEYYHDYNTCVYDNTILIFKNIINDNIKYIRRKDAKNEIGKDYVRLINLRRKSLNNWMYINTLIMY